MKKLNSLNITLNISYDTPDMPIDDILSEIRELIKNNKEKEVKTLKNSFDKEYLQINSSCKKETNVNYLDLNKEFHKTFQLMTDIECKNNCYNSPNNVSLKKGSVLHHNGEARNGDIFFKVDNKVVILPSNIVMTRFPYDKGVVDLNYLKKI